MDEGNLKENNIVGMNHLAETGRYFQTLFLIKSWNPVLQIVLKYFTILFKLLVKLISNISSKTQWRKTSIRNYPNRFLFVSCGRPASLSLLRAQVSAPQYCCFPLNHNHLASSSGIWCQLTCGHNCSTSLCVTPVINLLAFILNWKDYLITRSLVVQVKV